MKPFARRRARELALQAIYSWQLSKNSIFDIEYQFLSKLNFKKVDVIYFREILSGVVSNSIYLDQLIQLHLPNIFKKLGEIEKSVLRIALFELSKRDDIPYKVTINEAIELAKIFGPQNCHKFINGILDKIVAINFFSKKSD